MSERENWTQVRSRRRRVRELGHDKTDRNTGIYNGITTCYVENIPEDINEKEMERKFTRWGKVVDVYIANRRNKRGRLFGFVRFEGVEDQQRLENQLRNIWFGSYKSWVNISKFERKTWMEVRDKKVRRDNTLSRQKEGNRSREVWCKHRAGRAEGIIKEGISYADAIKNKGSNKFTSEDYYRRRNEAKDLQRVDSQMCVGISISVSEEEMLWAKRGYVGCVRNVEEIQSLQQRMFDEGINTIKVIPLGGEKVFLNLDEEEDFSVLVKESNHLFNRWFSVVRAWESRDVSAARFIWCRIYGVPVHAWRKKVFSIISNSLGRLIKVDAPTENMERLDIARVLIRTPLLEFINKTKRVQINNEIFTIRITEEICEG
ncbi:uncharacterized protein LOC131648999 [Vicia villosa]|uniref:uncharacterized protein LOC131648999 n=1 Tax=Vicia villosa TaxID=3911 RepID=UPI00273BBF33|nr:uncharacterized protein LOC131648999 [Vicia villosa]